MADPLSTDSVQKMDTAYTKISASKNSEIRFRWLRVCIKAKYEKCIDNALAMVTEQGRMKFTRPLYRDLYNWETAREKTVANFKENFDTLIQLLDRKLSAKIKYIFISTQFFGKISKKNFLLKYLRKTAPVCIIRLPRSSLKISIFKLLNSRPKSAIILTFQTLRCNSIYCIQFNCFSSC